MVQRASMKGRIMNVGDAVQIRIDQVDVSEADCENLTLIVAEKVELKKPCVV